MAIFAKKDAVLMCTGCPGVPAKLDAKDARTINLENGTIAVDSDKIVAQPAFGTCLIIPTTPRKCNPQLGTWMNVKSDVKCKGKSQILFPNTIPCTFGPGLVTMSYAGQVKASEMASAAQGGNKSCKWATCNNKHEFDITYPNDGVVERKDLKNWSHPSALIGLGHIPTFQANIAKKGAAKKSSNYPFQRHHVIPCAVIKQLTKIKANLKQLGFDINNEGLNGISLPKNPKDIKWHDIQAHRGPHPDYNNTVKNYLSELEGEVKDFCKDGKQGELWEKIDKAVARYRKRILKWQDTLRSGAAGERIAAAEAAAKSHL
jgi:A nuclease family of the HNH/ENDO VII superfamily with conserved AHH